jgi:hypothetical protein
MKAIAVGPMDAALYRDTPPEAIRSLLDHQQGEDRQQDQPAGSQSASRQRSV